MNNEVTKFFTVFFVLVLIIFFFRLFLGVTGFFIAIIARYWFIFLFLGVAYYIYRKVSIKNKEDEKKWADYKVNKTIDVTYSVDDASDKAAESDKSKRQ